ARAALGARRRRRGRGDRPVPRRRSSTRAGRARHRRRARRRRHGRAHPRGGARPVSKTLVIYLMAGPETPELVRAAVEGGADIIEFGIPFSDPLADGPVIRLAGERALAQGMRTKQCLECLAKTRELVDVPIVPMTYASLL